MRIDRLSRRAPDVVALLALALLAGALRLVGLANPPRPVFDEIYYAINGCLRVLGPGACGVDDFTSRAHPPGGELLIGLGQALFGPTPFGWRIAPALAGIALVLCTYLIARRLFAAYRLAVPAAFAAGALVAVDGLGVAMSRVAMLDIFVAVFAVAAVTVVVYLPLRPGTWQPGMAAAGVLVGAALASKWSAVLVVPLLLIIITVRATPAERWSILKRSTLLAAAAALVTYSAIFATSLDGPIWQWPIEMAQRHARMLAFHRSLAGHHPYESGPLGWLLLQRPVVLSFSSITAPGDTQLWRYTMAAGNPVIWWGGALATLAGLTSIARRRAPLAAVVAAAGLLCWWLPWLALGMGRSQIFGYYLLPALPFVAIGLIWLCADLVVALPRLGRPMAIGLAAIVMLAAIDLLPLSVGAALPPAEVQQRIWFDCPAADSAPSLPPDDEVQRGQPPSGWCWG